MLDPVNILQRARVEATLAVNRIDKSGDWDFVFDLMCNAVGHLIGARPFVEITHEGQPVVAVLDEVEAEHEADLAASDIDDGGVEDMEREGGYDEPDYNAPTVRETAESDYMQKYYPGVSR